MLGACLPDSCVPSRAQGKCLVRRQAEEAAHFGALSGPRLQESRAGLVWHHARQTVENTCVPAHTRRIPAYLDPQGSGPQEIGVGTTLLRGSCVAV